MELFIKKYAWVLYILFIALIAFFSAKIASTFIRQALAVEQKQNLNLKFNRFNPDLITKNSQEYASVSERNIFDSRKIEVEDPVIKDTKDPNNKIEKPKEIDLTKAAVKTNLGIKLISTFSVGDGSDARSMATISKGGGASESDIYYIGSKNSFAPGASIKKILPDRVEFVNEQSRQLEYVEIDSYDKTAASSSFTAPNTFNPSSKIIKGLDRFSNQQPEEESNDSLEQSFNVSRSELDQALTNPNALMQQARIRQDPQGIRLTYVRPGSPIAKLGVRRNDVLASMNGKKLSFASMLGLLPEIKQQNQFTLEVIRRGKTLKFSYEVQ